MQTGVATRSLNSSANKFSTSGLERVHVFMVPHCKFLIENGK